MPNAKQIIKKQIKEERDLTKERDDRILPVVQSFFQIIADKKDVVAGNCFTEEQRVKYYQDVYLKLIDVFEKNNLRIEEGAYMFRVCMQVIEFAKNITENSVDMNLEKANKILWGKEFKKLTINDLDKLLTENNK